MVCRRTGRVIKDVKKLKGIRLTNEASEILSYDQFRTLASDPSVSITLPQHQISKNFANRLVRNVTLQKAVRANSTKRWAYRENNPQLNTFPYGYVKASWC